MIDVPEKKDPLIPGFSLRFTPNDAMTEDVFMQKLRQVAAAPLKAQLPRAKIEITPAKDARTGESDSGANEYKVYMAIVPDFDAVRADKDAEESRVIRDTIRAKTLLEMGLKEAGLTKYLTGGLSL